MHVRLLTVADAGVYRALMLHAYTAAPDAFTSTPDERAAEPLAWWERRIADPTGLSAALGAWLGAELVGAVAMEYAAKPKTRHKAHLIGMFVKESARGHGAGLELVKAALAHARDVKHALTVGLTVTEGNDPAIRLYEVAGFEAWGVEPMAVHVDDGFKGKVHMSCRLEA
jgi:RimJ/RimL family protein N-acetyltransferase